MVRIILSTLALALCTSAALPALAQQMPPPEGAPEQNNPYAQPAPGSTTTPAQSKALLTRAKVWFGELQSGSVDRAQLASNANSNMSDATIANAKQMIGSLGKPVSFVAQRTGSQGGVTYGIFVVTFKNGQTVDFLFALDSTGKVTSLGLGNPH
ncbi:MAG TPA: hypothetical protein VFE16_06885 [Candidatus Cybelea sp.]|jgi:hypothetical protein|nr:hypothetical protein [Candidatus Cybelea sp.]